MLLEVLSMSSPNIALYLILVLAVRIVVELNRCIVGICIVVLLVNLLVSIVAVCGLILLLWIVVSLLVVLAVSQG